MYFFNVNGKILDPTFLSAELKSRHVAQTARSTARSRQARSSNAAVAHGHMEVIGKARPPEHNPIDGTFF